MSDSIQVKGRVVRKRVGAGSKSDHSAVCLQTARGQEYVLRRMGGNAFEDPELDALVDQEIEGEGKLAGQTLILTNFRTRET